MANIPPFGLRMQPDLKARVEEASRANNRSLNAEIIDRLETTLNRDIAETIRVLENKVLVQKEITTDIITLLTGVIIKLSVNDPATAKMVGEALMKMSSLGVEAPDDD